MPDFEEIYRACEGARLPPDLWLNGYKPFAACWLPRTI
jgi:hypothetical protein